MPTSLRHLEEEFLHIPGPGRTALGAQPAMQADILVLGHDAPGLEQAGDIDVLGQIERRRLQPAAQLGLVAVLGEADAIHRTDIDAGIAFDAELVGKDRLGVAIEAALCLLEGEHGIEAQLDLGLDVAQRQRQLLMRHLEPLVVETSLS